jgi:drug/metabolite transporter (DMT)-like permease
MGSVGEGTHRVPRIGAYAVFLAFCLLSAARDSLSELLFKSAHYQAHPVFVLFVFSVTTQAVAAVVMGMRLARKGGGPGIRLRETKLDIAYLNLFTLVAYLAFFLAIGTPLGAGLNAFIDYGSGPIFTALVGAFLLHEKLTRTFFVSLLIGAVGYLIFAASKVTVGAVSYAWWLGFGLALLSSLAGGFYRVYFKRLLNAGVDKAAIVLLRLVALSVALGLFLIWHPHYLRLDLLPQIVALGVAGFALPLFLVLFVIQSLSIASFSLLLFLLPVLTLLFSSALGYAVPTWLDLIAGGLVFLAVFVYEKSARRTS